MPVSSPRRNRVTPFGLLAAVSARGRFMGNRGILAPSRAAAGLTWTTKAWVCCRTEYGGRRVAFDDPHHYTPLFFADEAVALAAGHRPCGACRHADYEAFKAAYRRACGLADAAPLTAPEMDQALHAARVRDGRKVTFAAPLGELPAGTFLTRPGAPEHALLLTAGGLRAWSHAGYGPPEPAAPDERVSVLTPAPTVAALKAGYRIHDLPEAGTPA